GTCAFARPGASWLAGASRASLPRSTSCMAAVAVMALVIEAIHTTVSSVMGASLPSSRRPKAPSYSTPLSVAAIATMPGIAFDSTACVKLASTFFSVAMRVSPSAPPVRRLRQLVEPHRSTGEDLALRLDRQLRPVGDHLGRA